MKVLFVDDDQNISSFVKMGLEDNDCFVDVAYDSNYGEKLALEKKFDVIVLDVILPGVNGFELCKKIRSNNIDTPILMLTSLDSPENKVEAYNCGANDYLLKPFRFPELFNRLKSLWNLN